MKDANRIVGVPVAFNDLVGGSASGCEALKVAYVCNTSERNGADDPNGGAIPANGFVCFKAKCEGQSPSSRTLATRFGESAVTGDSLKGNKLFCVPYTQVF